jgi:hypothetical protein
MYSDHIAGAGHFETSDAESIPRGEGQVLNPIQMVVLVVFSLDHSGDDEGRKLRLE